jgi:hypothetical protein
MKTKSILLVLGLAVQCALAQETPPKSNANRPVAGGGTPVPFSTGTIVRVTPRTSVVLKLDDGTTRSFKFAAQAPCFDKAGALVDETSISKGSRVLAHFMVENGQVLVDRLLVQP